MTAPGPTHTNPVEPGQPTNFMAHLFGGENGENPLNDLAQKAGLPALDGSENSIQEFAQALINMIFNRGEEGGNTIANILGGMFKHPNYQVHDPDGQPQFAAAPAPAGPAVNTAPIPGSTPAAPAPTIGRG